MIERQALLPPVLKSISAAFASLDKTHNSLSTLNREVLFQLCILESGRQKLFQGRLPLDDTLRGSLRNIDLFFTEERLRLPSGGWRRFSPSVYPA